MYSVNECVSFRFLYTHLPTLKEVNVKIIPTDLILLVLTASPNSNGSLNLVKI